MPWEFGDRGGEGGTSFWYLTYHHGIEKEMDTKGPWAPCVFLSKTLGGRHYHCHLQ